MLLRKQRYNYLNNMGFGLCFIPNNEKSTSENCILEYTKKIPLS